MTDQPSNIVPFGKYKGRLIEEVLADDSGYLQWLAGQEWFRSKFAVLYQVIINRGAETEETPDHNAMQVKFLDDNFCFQFWRRLLPNYEADVWGLLNSARTKNLEAIVRVIKRREEVAPREADDELARRLQHISESEYFRRNPDQVDRAKADAHTERENARNKQREYLAKLNRARDALSIPLRAKFSVGREFEVNGVDVVLSIAMPTIGLGLPPDKHDAWDLAGEWRDWRAEVDWHKECCIEIKPTVGDDYPAVLRQMKRTGSNVLFVGEYTGQGATQEQFVKTMATAGIRVVFARDVEST